MPPGQAGERSWYNPGCHHICPRAPNGVIPERICLQVSAAQLCNSCQQNASSQNSSDCLTIYILMEKLHIIYTHESINTYILYYIGYLGVYTVQDLVQCRSIAASWDECALDSGRAHLQGLDCHPSCSLNHASKPGELGNWPCCSCARVPSAPKMTRGDTQGRVQSPASCYCHSKHRSPRWTR